MRIVKCRKCQQRLFDIDEDNYRKIVIKIGNMEPVCINYTNIPDQSKESKFDISGSKDQVLIYIPADELMQYQCPRCKVKLNIRLKTGYMNETK